METYNAHKTAGIKQRATMYRIFNVKSYAEPDAAQNSVFIFFTFFFISDFIRFNLLITIMHKIL